MLPGPSKILKCPYCHDEKKVMSLMSGSTFGAILWSDNKLFAPMMPKLSYVQKCLSCGCYYFTNRVSVRYSHHGDFSMSCGDLDFRDLCNALIFFETEIQRSSNYQRKLFHSLKSGTTVEKKMSEEDEYQLRLMIIHAYNDNFRFSSPKQVTEADKMMFEQNALALIQKANWNENNILLKAELYRELERYDDCIKLLSELNNLPEKKSRHKEQILSKALLKESSVFQFKPVNTESAVSNNSEVNTIIYY